MNEILRARFIAGAGTLAGTLPLTAKRTAALVQFQAIGDVCRRACGQPAPVVLLRATGRAAATKFEPMVPLLL